MRWATSFEEGGDAYKVYSDVKVVHNKLVVPFAASSIGTVEVRGVVI